MTNSFKKAFTLIEVLVSVFLIFIIGFTLTKISSQNIEIIEDSKEDYTYLYSCVVNSTHEYNDVNDFLNIRDIPKYEIKIKKKRKTLTTVSQSLSETFVINYTTEKESIQDGNKTKSFFHIQ